MTTRTTRDRLPQPPGICDDCYCDQTHHPLDAGHVIYYCSHHDCLALPKQGGEGWLVETNVDSAEWKRRAHVAERTLDLIAGARKKMN